MLASPFANMGITYVLTKHLAERPGDLAWRRNLAAFCGLTNLIAALSVGAVVGILLLRYPVSGRSPVILATVVVGIIIFEQVWFYSRGILYGLHREELATLPAALGAILSAALGVGMAFSGLGVVGVLAGILIANLAVAIVTFRYTYQFLKWRGGSDTLDIFPAWNMMKFGLSSMLLAILNMALYRADIILVRHLAGDVQVGLYAAAVQWAEFVWFLAIAVQAVMLQSTSQLWTEQRIHEITMITCRLFRYVTLGTALLLIVVSVLAEEICLLYFGPHFVAASLPLRILAPGVFGFALARVLWPIIQARGNILQLVTVTASATFANLALNWFLVPIWGAAGAAVAASIAYISVVFAYAKILRGYGVSPLEGSEVNRFVLLCIVTVAALVPTKLLISSAFIVLIVGSLLATTIYGLGTLWLGLLKVQEIESIIESLPNPLRLPGRKVFELLQPLMLRFEACTLSKSF
jgi:O-antigen/teichoic acid export membrane protein